MINIFYYIKFKNFQKTSKQLIEIGRVFNASKINKKFYKKEQIRVAEGLHHSYQDLVVIFEHRIDLIAKRRAAPRTSTSAGASREIERPYLPFPLAVRLSVAIAEQLLGLRLRSMRNGLRRFLVLLLFYRVAGTRVSVRVSRAPGRYRSDAARRKIDDEIERAETDGLRIFVDSAIYRCSGRFP